VLAERVERASLLHKLECVSPGLSQNNPVAQSGCFIFRNGAVFAYNEEVCCRVKSGLDPGFTGAVTARAFVDLLRKMTDDLLSLDVAGAQLVVEGLRASGKKAGRRARLNMEAEIVIPLDDLERPTKDDWQPAHEEFNDAVNVVQGCAGSDASQLVGTCIHIHPKWVEATDGYQLCRYRLQTGVKEPVLVKRDHLKHAATLDVTQLAETRAWVHFRNPAGVVLSIKRQVDKYPDLKPMYEVEGSTTTLPKGLAEAVGIATIFSKENADSNLLIVTLEPGDRKNLTLTAVGTSGDYAETHSALYEGDPIQFTIPPEILAQIASKHSDVVLTAKRMKVEGGKWKYITSLGQPEAVKPPKRKEKKDDREEAGEGESDPQE